MTCGTVIEHQLTVIQSVCIKQQHEANILGKIIFYHLKIIFCLKRKVYFWTIKVFWTVILFSWEFFIPQFSSTVMQRNLIVKIEFIFLMQNNFFRMKYDSDVFLTGFVRFILECCSKNTVILNKCSSYGIHLIIQVHLNILVRTK